MLTRIMPYLELSTKTCHWTIRRMLLYDFFLNLNQSILYVWFGWLIFIRRQEERTKVYQFIYVTQDMTAKKDEYIDSKHSRHARTKVNVLLIRSYHMVRFFSCSFFGVRMKQPSYCDVHVLHTDKGQLLMKLSNDESLSSNKLF